MLASTYHNARNFINQVTTIRIPCDALLGKKKVIVLKHCIIERYGETEPSSTNS